MSRTMVYPYTFGAMLRAFPLKFHVQKSWVYKVTSTILHVFLQVYH